VKTTHLVFLAAVSFACAAPRAGSVAPAPEPGASAHAEVLPFIENDYARAMAEAKAKGVPVFVDVWAPW
jgi:hypothetical protein